MPCGDFNTYREFLTAGQFFDAVYCPFGDALGGVLFATIFFGGVAMALYVYSETIVLPLVVTILLGSVVVTQIGAPAVSVVGFALVVGLMLAIYVIVMRMNRRR